MAKKPGEPFKKINFLSRKAKDERNAAKLESTLQTGGKYSFRKRSNKPMKVGGKTVATRGSVVTGESKKTPAMVGSGKFSSEQSMQRGATSRSYQAKEIETGHPAYGKAVAISKRNPGLTEALKKAQMQKKDVAEYKGKPYKAGTTTVTKQPDKFKTSTSYKSPGLMFTEKKSVSVQKPGGASMARSKGSDSKRRLKHVEYLERLKKNKRTEAGHGR